MKKILVLTTIVVTILILLWWNRAAEASNITPEEIVKTYSLQDGVTIAVHYRPIELKPYHAYPDIYADMVLQYAAQAYNKIVYEQGFDTPGFTFANPDKDYCYDQDKTIDIYIAINSSEVPCYDITEGKGTDYDAIILFPADYKAYLGNSETGDINDFKIVERIRGTLFHEMFHIITYSYNKNIEPWYSRCKGISRYQGGDWYVEGLARYFETIAGSYDNFFSKGFVERNSDKIIISQEGANFLMEHPSQSLKEARYDYSLFWAYIHKTYGMKRIEEISRRFRFITEEGMKNQVPRIISTVLKKDFEDVLKDFAIAMYFKRFNSDIKEGLNDLKSMSLDDFLDIPEKGIASWASNFIALDFNRQDIPQAISLKRVGEGSTLKMTVIAGLEGNKIAQLREIALDRSETVCKMNLNDMKRNGVKALILIITNTSPNSNTKYKIFRY